MPQLKVLKPLRHLPFSATQEVLVVFGDKQVAFECGPEFALREGEILDFSG
jgi:hypothetical protein